MYKILISGYYGFNNVGDEAILKGLLDGIKARINPVDLVVLSKYPDFTSKKHNIRSFNRINIFKMLREMRSMDLLISGGGSLFQDVTSKRSIAYYLFIIWLAKRIFRKKVMIYSQGIGPVTKKYNRYLLCRILNQLDFINVRDEKSRNELMALGVHKDILVTIDTVFGIERPSLDRGIEILSRYHKMENQHFVGISVRNWSNSEKLVEEIATLCSRIVLELGYVPVLIPFHFYRDLKLMEEIYRHIPQEIRSQVVVMDHYLYVDDYLSLIGTMDLMISMRLHGLIFAALMGVFPIGISYDPKIQSFMHMMGREDAIEVEQIDAAVLFEQVLDAVANYQSNQGKLQESIQEFKTLTNLHNDAIIKLLED